MDLTETAGPRRWGLYFIKMLIIAILFATIILSTKLFFLSIRTGALAPILNSVVILVLFFVGYLITIALAPKPVQKLFTFINRFFFKGVKLALIKLAKGLKEFFNIILNW